VKAEEKKDEATNKAEEEAKDTTEKPKK
jgi:hypothetical protein